MSVTDFVWYNFIEKRALFVLGLHTLTKQSETHLMFLENNVRSCLKRNTIISHCLGVQSRKHATTLIHLSNTLRASKRKPECVNSPQTKKPL